MLLVNILIVKQEFLVSIDTVTNSACCHYLVVPALEEGPARREDVRVVEAACGGHEDLGSASC